MHVASLLLEESRFSINVTFHPAGVCPEGGHASLFYFILMYVLLNGYNVKNVNTGM